MFKHYQQRTAFLVGLIMGFILIWVLFVWPAQADSTLPPRDPLPVQVDETNDDDDDDDRAPVGAYIELAAQPTLAGQWSQIEWQDSNGNWQSVEGWGGWLDQQGQRRWWVAAKDFGTGPFRWVVSPEVDGLGGLISENFFLPTESNQIVKIGIN